MRQVSEEILDLPVYFIFTLYSLYKTIDLIVTFSFMSTERTITKNVQYDNEKFVSKFKFAEKESEEENASATATEMWTTKRPGALARANPNSFQRTEFKLVMSSKVPCSKKNQ